MASDDVAVTGTAFGVALRLEAPAALRAALTETVPYGWVAGPVDGDAAAFRFDRDDEGERAAFANRVELHVAEHAPQRVFVHAGAVVIDGRGILLPGRSLAGKSTLVRALVQAGATYYSDDFAVLDEQALLHPYARPLNLRSRDRLSMQRVDPHSIGAVGVDPVPVALVAQLRFDGRWDVADLAPARRVLALIDNAIAAQTRPAEVLARCAAAMRDAHGIAGTRGEAEQAAAALIELVQAR